MKIVLDLKHSMNNYEWESKEELQDFIDNYMLKVLWDFYAKNDLEHNENNLTDEEQNKLYDILDMFRSYKIEKATIEEDTTDDYINVRHCNECGKEMWDGFCIESGMEYYCSEECLHKNISEEEYNELYDDGNGDSYWTDWYDEYEEYKRLKGIKESEEDE